MSRKWWVQLSLGIVLCALLAAGVILWQRQRLDRRVEQAVASLAQGGTAWLDENLAAEMLGNPRYDPELHLFRGAVLLRTGKPEAVSAVLAGVRPEGRIREPLLLVA